MNQLNAVAIINASGFEVRSQKIIKPLRQGYYVLKEGWSVGGDAPKDFLQVYQYGEGKRSNPASWPAYIAKIGHKWYPNESITEQLITRIGQVFGINIADSMLVWADGQIRFLSKYFLKNNESLVHGAEIFAGYLEDPDFVEEVEVQQLSRELFTFQFIKEAIESRFSDNSPSIMNDFVRMLAFDAIIGNQDRHFYNWGVIRHDFGLRPPRFSPIYDTARALFWNDSEEKIARRTKHPGQLEDFLENYINGSRPKIGWDGLDSLSHLHLIQSIWQDYSEYRGVIEDLYQCEAIRTIEAILNSEFRLLMSELRRGLILECLRRRLNYYKASLVN